MSMINDQSSPTPHTQSCSFRDFKLWTWIVENWQDLGLDFDSYINLLFSEKYFDIKGYVEEAKQILSWLHSLSPDIYVNVMEQYRPTHKVGVGEQRVREGFTKYEDIDRYVEMSEVDQVRQHARDIGLWRLEDMELLCKPLTEF